MSDFSDVKKPMLESVYDINSSEAAQEVLCRNQEKILNYIESRFDELLIDIQTRLDGLLIDLS